ncbi:MAG: hypothetical protein J5854_01060 [Clostridia bacterium]|nr:hypothetical protein [Clostridia bacterium]
MRKIKPFLAAFLLLAAIALALALVRRAGEKKNTSYDGAKFAAEKIGITLPERVGGDTVTAVKFACRDQFV